MLAKAWDQVDQISRRGFFVQGKALITGAGPIGLMACLLGVQRGYEVHVVDLAVAGAKRDLVEDLGARYHAGDAAEIDVEVDVVIECTGLGAVGRSAASRLVSGGIMCLTGLMSLDPTLDVDATALNRAMVLRNVVMFGTVNAGKRHWEQAAVALAAADAVMAERPDHPPRTPRSLDRGARPAARRHQGCRGPHGVTVPEVTAWSGTPGLLSEGPRWHEQRQELLWVDILGRHMHRGTLTPDGALDRVETISIDRHIGAVAPAIGGGYVLAAGPGFLFVDDTGRVHELAQPEADRTDVRMNDGACDPQGRFWAGTMAYDESPGAGSLYRLELDGTCTTVLTGLTISNGIGWSPDASTMYLNDSGTGCVDAFHFDGATGAISERRTLVHIDQPRGRTRRAHRRRRRRNLGSALGRRGRQPVRTRRLAPRHRAGPGRASHFLRVRRTRPGHPIRHHRPRGSRRGRPRPPTRRGSSVLDRRLGSTRPPLPAVSRPNTASVTAARLSTRGTRERRPRSGRRLAPTILRGWERTGSVCRRH